MKNYSRVLNFPKIEPGTVDNFFNLHRAKHQELNGELLSFFMNSI
jgi:hypothetical protein